MSLQKDKKTKILVASAWTGGHIFPGISVCEEIKRHIDVEIFFITNKKGALPYILNKYNYKVLFLDEIKNKNILKLFLSFLKALYVVKKISPSVILGMGGAISGLICMAGKMFNIPVFIHEQNLYPGLTNRILSHFADKIFVSFQKTKEILRKKNIIVSGNPVRKEFFYIKKQKNPVFTILVMGGSQGSSAINHAFLDAVSILNREGRNMNIIHQTGDREYEEIKNKYKELGIQAHVTAFIEDVASVFKKVDLVISRAGASTIFELSASGTPSILIPYPYAADQHQEKNAFFLAKIGAAEVILQKELSGKRLADSIKRYMSFPEELKKMQKNVKALAQPESAYIIAKHIMEQIYEGIG